MDNMSKIREHMEVLASDGQHVGRVDHMEGADKIKLTKSDPTSSGTLRRTGSSSPTTTALATTTG